MSAHRQMTIPVLDEGRLLDEISALLDAKLRESEDRILKTLDSQGAQDDSMLTVRDLARRLSCDEKSVYRWVEDEKVPSPVRIGGVLRWEKRVIDKWLSQGGSGHSMGKVR